MTGRSAAAQSMVMKPKLCEERRSRLLAYLEGDRKSAAQFGAGGRKAGSGGEL